MSFLERFKTRKESGYDNVAIIIDNSRSKPLMKFVKARKIVKNEKEYWVLKNNGNELLVDPAKTFFTKKSFLQKFFKKCVEASFFEKKSENDYEQLDIKISSTSLVAIPQSVLLAGKQNIKSRRIRYSVKNLLGLLMDILYFVLPPIILVISVIMLVKALPQLAGASTSSIFSRLIPGGGG